MSNCEKFTGIYNYTLSPTLVKPSNVRIFPGITSMSATWNIVPEAEEYRIVVTDGNKKQTFTEKDTAFYIRSGLKPDTEYTFHLVATTYTTVSPAYITTFRTMVDNSTPVFTVEEKPECVTDADCANGKGKPFCTSGVCKACDQSLRIGVDSDCYLASNPCIDGQCVPCNSQDQTFGNTVCSIGYGSDHRCNMDTGHCELTPVVSPPNNNGLKWLYLVLIIIAVILIIAVVIAMVLFFISRNRKSRVIYTTGGSIIPIY